MFGTAGQACMQVDLGAGQHPGDLGVEVELCLSDLPGFADLLVCEVAIDERLVLGFYCYQPLSWALVFWCCRVFTTRYKLLQLALNREHPGYGEVIAGSGGGIVAPVLAGTYPGNLCAPSLRQLRKKSFVGVEGNVLGRAHPHKLRTLDAILFGLAPMGVTQGLDVEHLGHNGAQLLIP